MLAMLKHEIDIICNNLSLNLSEIKFKGALNPCNLLLNLSEGITVMMLLCEFLQYLNVSIYIIHFFLNYSSFKCPRKCRSVSRNVRVISLTFKTV